MDFLLLKKTSAQLECPAVLSKYTSFQLGGPAPCVVTCQTAQQLEKTIQLLAEFQQKFIVIGAGTNILVSDDGTRDVVVRYVSEAPQIRQEKNACIVSASTRMDDLVRFCAANGLEGLSFANGIPGTVGGAVYGNAGAFGKQVGDCLTGAVVMDCEGKTHKISNKDLSFGYRHSKLKETHEIVLEATFELTSADPKKLQWEREAILKERWQKHPDPKIEPSAGSFFRNIEPTAQAERRRAAGWFLEQAGAKNMRRGGASVYSKHANIIVKSGDCRAQDVFDLAQKMKDAVSKKFRISLVREVQLIGKFQGMPSDVTSVIW